MTESSRTEEPGQPGPDEAPELKPEEIRDLDVAQDDGDDVRGGRAWNCTNSQ